MSNELQLTLEQYDRLIARGAFARLEKRIELIFGELREMNPAGPVHDDLIRYLIRWSRLRTSPTEVDILSQSGVALGDVQSRPAPDLFWVRAQRYLNAHPGPEDILLLVEVGDSSLDYDLSEKGGLYSQAGVGEYWVVDIDSTCVHVFRQPSSAGYDVAEKFYIGDELIPLAVPAACLSLEKLFGGLKSVGETD